MPIDKNVRDVAGAVGAISREYRNSRTNERVNLWLIVGHARAISSHTPNICYPASGFEQRAARKLVVPDGVSRRAKGPVLDEYVLQGGREWAAPGARVLVVAQPADRRGEQGQSGLGSAENSRWHFGNTRALYKMYFTSEMRDTSETAEQSACLRFAREFMPIVNEALADVHGQIQAAEAASSGQVAADEPAKEEVSETEAVSAFDQADADAATESSGAAEGQAAPAP